MTELNRKIQFISDRESILFDNERPKYHILKFKIPVWKRLFDIVFSILAIIVTSPIFILTAIAIRLESKGPIVFKSKRVGTNYTIFDFLKFRSMYVDAEQRLQELSKDHNQYSTHEQEEHKTIVAPLGDQAEQAMYDMGMESEMMISDEEIMLVGDDFVVAESDFSKQKEEENNNAFKVELKRGKDGEDSSLGLKIEGSATRGNTTVPVNLDVTFHGDLDQLINTGMKLRRKTR